MEPLGATVAHCVRPLSSFPTWLIYHFMLCHTRGSLLSGNVAAFRCEAVV